VVEEAAAATSASFSVRLSCLIRASRDSAADLSAAASHHTSLTGRRARV